MSGRYHLSSPPLELYGVLAPGYFLSNPHLAVKDTMSVESRLTMKPHDVKAIVVETMAKNVRTLNFDRAFAHKDFEAFAKFKGPFFVDAVYKVIENEDGKKVVTDEIANMFVRKIVGPLAPDGITVPPESQGDTIAFVSTNYDPEQEGEFAAFRDEDGQLQWILQNKTEGFAKKAVLVYGV